MRKKEENTNKQLGRKKHEEGQKNSLAGILRKPNKT